MTAPSTTSPTELSPYYTSAHVEYEDHSKGSDDLEERTRKLAQKEAELRAREQNLNNNSTTKTSKKNWPAFYPLFHHNIDELSDSDAQALATRSYFIWKLTLFAYLWNLVAITALLFSAVTPHNSLSSFIASIVYAVIFPSLSFLTWQLSLYHALLKNSSIRYILYFVSFGVQMAFFIFLALGWQIGGGGGIMALISALSQGKYVAAVLSGASVGCLAFSFLLGTIQMKAIAERYQSKGHSAGNAKKEAIQGVLKSDHAKNYAQNYAKDAALSAI